MPGGLGLRVALLAAALVAVAVICVLADWSTLTIVAVMTVSFLIVSAVEIVASRREAQEPAAAPAVEPAPAPAVTGEEMPQHVRVLREQEERRPEPEPE